MCEEKRLDAVVREKTGFPRNYIQEIIKDGKVRVNGEIARKSGQKIQTSSKVDVLAQSPAFVSRGGVKLNYALEYFNIDVKGLICADFGASSGGFTHCLLKRGAARVYAVDAGARQLSTALKQDARVINMEKTDVRGLSPFPDNISFAAADLSFISITLVIDDIYRLLAEKARFVCLIKPQFEAGKGNVGKGVVKNAKIIENAVKNAAKSVKDAGFSVIGTVASPIAGFDGNAEFLLYAERE